MLTPQSGKQQLVNAALKRIGLDPEIIGQHIANLNETIANAAAKLTANQATIEAKLDTLQVRLDNLDLKIEALRRDAITPLGSTTMLTDGAGRDTNILVTSERFPNAMLRDLNIATE